MKSYLTKLRLIRWPVWKTLSHALKSSFSASLMVLTIRTTFWSSDGEIVTYQHHEPKDGQFFFYTPLNHCFYLVSWCLSSERHFGAVSVNNYYEACDSVFHALLLSRSNGIQREFHTNSSKISL